jgi:hypothetical protein
MTALEHARYARCVELAQRVRWDIDRDVIRGRRFDFGQRFMPEGLARTGGLEFLRDEHLRLLNQVQGRSYVNLLGCAERFIGAKVLELTRLHGLGDPVALRALVQFADEELKHQVLFSRIESMLAEGMPAGYRFEPDPNIVAGVLLQASTWALLALTCHIELLTQVHHRSSMQADAQLSALFKDVFLFHWREESQHAVLDELEWRREDARLTPAERERAVDELVRLLGTVDTLLVVQAQSDTRYFCAAAGLPLSPQQVARVGDCLLRAYRWQFIGSGSENTRWHAVLGSMTTPVQRQRIGLALASLFT